MLYILFLGWGGMAFAQIPEELIDKAKTLGLTEEQIRQEIAKRMSRGTAGPPAETTRPDAEQTGREPLPEAVIPPLEQQREKNRPLETDKSETVFGREIFAGKELSFEPDLNIPTPKGYVLSAGDAQLINVWGDSELNLKLKVSPEGTLLIPNLGPVVAGGLTVEEAEARLRQALRRIISTLSPFPGGAGGNTFVSVSLSQIRSIKVNIVGEVVAPGKAKRNRIYEMKKGETLQDLLDMAARWRKSAICSGKPTGTKDMPRKRPSLAGTTLSIPSDSGKSIPSYAIRMSRLGK